MPRITNDDFALLLLHFDQEVGQRVRERVTVSGEFARLFPQVREENRQELAVYMLTSVQETELPSETPEEVRLGIMMVLALEVGQRIGRQEA